MPVKPTEVKPRGIYVAFDGEGRHFAYAKHPEDIREIEGLKDPDREARQQQAAIDSYRRQARELGGDVELLTPDEYQRRVIDTRPPT